jgi:hypothetical protein
LLRGVYGLVKRFDVLADEGVGEAVVGQQGTQA